MNSIERVRIEKFAPTGEGIARLGGKAVFVDGALPQEELEIELVEVRARFDRARVRSILVASPDRRLTDSHSVRCGGTDWAHVDLAAARTAKRKLFLETMEHIGKLDSVHFGVLPIGESGLRYRLRNQFQIEVSGAGAVAGFFERRSHRIVPLDRCEIVSEPTLEKIGSVAREIGRNARAGSHFKVRTVETIETDDRHILAVDERAGGKWPTHVEMHAGGPTFQAGARSFFQGNRHRVGPFYEEVRRRAAAVGGGSALDACAGVGFFSRALLDSGYLVTSVESSSDACADARVNRQRCRDAENWRIVEARLDDFLKMQEGSYDLVLADPPRDGLTNCAADLARRCKRSFFYVSCDPATLARDLRDICREGFDIEHVALEDFFPLTHRVEAFVVLSRRR